MSGSEIERARRAMGVRARAALRPVVRAAFRQALKVADPVSIARWATEAAPDPVQTAAALAQMAESFAPPTAVDVVANYARGLVLFGAPLADNHFTWTSVLQRAVIEPRTAKVPKRLRSVQNRNEVEIRFDHDFESVIAACKRGHNSWLTTELIDIYRDVHRLGFVATVETYRDGNLVGGLWGVELGRTLGIMSMFHVEDHAGALAMAAVAEVVARSGRWTLVDCGELNNNFARYGAIEITREQFCNEVLGRTRVDHGERSDQGDPRTPDQSQDSRPAMSPTSNEPVPPVGER